MVAIAGESLLYEVSRILNANKRVSYYQYRALVSFVEVIVLHDRLTLFVGNETDRAFAESYDWLINTIHEKSDFKIDLILPKNRDEYITPKGLRLFESICTELYQYPLGVTSSELFNKQRKDRTAEDMADRLERMFCQSYPNFDSRQFAEGLYNVWLSNANSSELLYFFRAHLFQAIAEIKNLTPVFENQKLMADALQQRSRPKSRVGTLPFTIYKAVEGLFIQTCKLLPDDHSEAPRPSILIYALVGSINRREELLDAILNLRKEFQDYRKSYKKIQDVWTSSNVSLFDRSEMNQLLEDSVRRVWLPIIATLGRNHTPNVLKKIGKNLFGKYGVGDVTFEHEIDPDSSEGKVSYSTPSLVGVGTALAQTISEVYKDSRLLKPNKSLLETLNRVVRLAGVQDKLSEILPVHNYRYRIYKLLDSVLAEKVVEVTK